MRFVTIPLLLVVAAAAPSAIRVNQQRIEQRILKLAEFGKHPDGGVNRVAFSKADIEGRKYLTELMREAGLSVRVDAAGNIIGRREGSEPGRPVIMFGSHIDSVPQGGKYDGDVGVIAAIECVEILNQHDFATLHPLEVIVFSDEEGSMVGSSALAGDLSPRTLEMVSQSGVTIREGLRAIGGDPDGLASAAYAEGEIAAFLELHVEQGSVLFDEGTQIGVVEGIVRIHWWEITIDGSANHAGTTPMNKRRDAMVAAARLTLAINEIVTRTPGRQVGTVGRIRAEPGAPNVIPGRVVMSLELRDLSAEKIERIFERIEAQARSIGEATGTEVAFEPIYVGDHPPPTDSRVRRLIDESARSLGLTTKQMPSGAGHDAQEMARIAPTGVIFVPSVEGISHSPKEFTHPDDMANGANVLLQTILRIDRGGLESDIPGS
ncbi:MAG: Zn-dependent hydrolase [Deltaproteobacteria bacterium]|nr:Zn-dependent hydrolase [Deltaproteobacteria bacterium]